MNFKDALDNFKTLYDERLTTGTLRTSEPMQAHWTQINLNLHLYYISYRVGDTDICTECINAILLILSGYGYVVDELPVDIINSGGGGGVVPNDQILDWDGLNLWYKAYATRAEVNTSLKFYSEAANEIPNANISGSLSLNGRFTAGSSNSGYSSFGLYGSTYSGTGVRGDAVTGYAIHGHSESGYGVFAWSTSGKALTGSTTNGKAASFETSGNALSSDRTSNLIETQSNENAGAYNVSGTIHYTVDNPTLTTGVNTKRYAGYVAGSTERLSMYPRVVDGAGNKAYLWDTVNSLSSANHTEFKNAGTIIKAIAPNGNEETIRGQYVYHRQVIGTDTDGDVRTYSNASGYFIERRESGSWVSKFDITF